MTWLLILFGVEVICLGISFTINRKDIMAPSVLLTIVFMLSTFIAIINADKWRVNYPWEACLILSIGIFLFCITDGIIRNFAQSKAKREVPLCKMIEANKKICHKLAVFHLKVNIL